ncbi:MAG TPA: 23S rRNA (guanosine(2251)-2'-O)-methyltransferase RlmB [Oculatellaceae cyanobacterium]
MTQPKSEDELIFGKNAVLAFLEQCKSAHGERQGRKAGPSKVSVNKVYIATGLHHDRRMEQVRVLCRELKIPIIESERKKLDTMLPREQRENNNHQGVIAQVSAAEFLGLEEFFKDLDSEREHVQKSGGKDPIDTFAVAVLDGIEDPHNLGAIVRVAEAAGLKAIILPNRRSAGLTGTVAKTSAGALANMPIVRITNLTNALTKLKDYGFWIAGLSVAADCNYFQADLKRPMALVIGSEGEGMGRLVEKNCDMLLRIPMLGKTQSLNASVASGIVFYEFVRQKMLNS